MRAVPEVLDPFTEVSCCVTATPKFAMVSAVAVVLDPISVVSYSDIMFPKIAEMEFRPALLDLVFAGSCGDVLFTKTAMVEVVLFSNYRGLLGFVVTSATSVPPFPLLVDSVDTLASVFCYWTERP